MYVLIFAALQNSLSVLVLKTFQVSRKVVSQTENTEVNSTADKNSDSATGSKGLKHLKMIREQKYKSGESACKQHFS